MTSDIKRFNVPINDFFDGNTEDYDGTVVKTYTLKATSSNGNEVELEINSRHLTRKQKTPVSNSPPVSTNTGTSRWRLVHHRGEVRLQAFVGLFADGEKEMDDGKHGHARVRTCEVLLPATVHAHHHLAGRWDTVHAPRCPLDGLWQSGRLITPALRSSPVFGFLPLWSQHR